jgi:hypothetical protein
LEKLLLKINVNVIGHFGKGFNRAKAGFEPTASAHEAEILPLNYFAMNYMDNYLIFEREIS